jgi:hypothetical protein
MDLQDLIQQAEQYVQTSPDEELILGWRLRLWSAMNSKYREQSILRRSVLAFAVACETLPAWDKAHILEEFHPLPRRLLTIAKDLLLNRISRGEADRFRTAQYRDVDYMGSVFQQHGPGVLAAQAAYHVFSCILGEEEACYRQRNLNEEGEPSWYEQTWTDDAYLAIREEEHDYVGWETHRFASLVFGFVRTPSGSFELNHELIREYWLAWMHEKLPLALDGFSLSLLDQIPF